MRNIVVGIATADLVVAELTTLNPNVLYELGMAHGLNIPTVIIAQSIEDVPFDLRAYRVQIYCTRFDTVHELKETLREIAEKRLAGEIAFGSPVSDFLPSSSVPATAETTSPTIAPPSKTEGREEMEEREAGWLDHMVAAESAAEAIGKSLELLTKETLLIGENLEGHTRHLTELAQNPAPGSAAKVHKVAIATADDMNTFSESVENVLPEFQQNTDKLSEAIAGFAALSHPTSEKEMQSLESFARGISSLLPAVRTALEGSRGFRESVASITGVSKATNKASRRMAAALDAVISSFEKLEAVSVRTLQVIATKTGSDKAGV